MQEGQVDRNIEAQIMFKQRVEFIEEERPLTPIPVEEPEELSYDGWGMIG